MACGCKKKKLARPQPQTITEVVVVDGEIRVPDTLRVPAPTTQEIIDKLNNIT